MQLRGQIQFPGDKSLSHRAILMAALATSPSTLSNLSNGRDVASTIRVLEQCGTRVTLENKTVRVTPAALTAPEAPLNCGNSGTTARLLAGLLSGLGIPATITGDPSLSNRPMHRVTAPLQNMGAIISSTNGRLPIHITPSQLTGITYELPVASAQVKSAILLAGLYAAGPTKIIEPAATRDHTEIYLQNLGVEISKSGNVIELEPVNHKWQGFSHRIPGDPSTAAFFAAAACMLPGSDIILKDILLNPTRAGFFQALSDMGADVEMFEPHLVQGELVGDIHVRSGKLHSIQLDGSAIPSLIDELPILALLATRASGTTIIRDAAELRVKECDRIHAVCQNLVQLGARIRELPDGMVIDGPVNLEGRQVQSFGDHRIAMTMIIADLICSGKVMLDESECIQISSPEFKELLSTSLVT